MKASELKAAEQKKEYWKKYSAENRQELLEKSRKYKKDNRERILKRRRELYVQNRDHILKQQQEWRAANPGKGYKVEHSRRGHEKYRSIEENRERECRLERDRRARNPEKGHQATKRYRDKNPHKIRIYEASRRASKLSATPKWLTSKHKEEIESIYIKAQKMSLTVDHIIPLSSRIVCGLHVPWNLQLLSQSENSRKGNKVL